MPRSQFLQNIGARYIAPAFAAAAPFLWKETQRAGRVALNSAVRRAVHSGINKMPYRRRYRMRSRMRRGRRRMPVRARRRKLYRRTRYKRYRGGRMRLRQNTLRQAPVYRRRRPRRQARSDRRICAAVRRCMQEKKELIVADGSQAFNPITMQVALDVLGVAGWSVSGTMSEAIDLLQNANAPVQGDGRNQRTGDTIYVTGIKLGLDFCLGDNLSHYNSTQWITCMVFKTQGSSFTLQPDDVWDAPTIPHLSQILRTEDRDQSKPFQILWKRTFSYNLDRVMGHVPSSTITLSSIATGNKEGTKKSVSMWIPIREKITYDRGATTLKNCRYSFVIFQHAKVRPATAGVNLMFYNIREHRVYFKE